MSLVIGESAVETVEYWQTRALKGEARAESAEEKLSAFMGIVNNLTLTTASEIRSHIHHLLHEENMIQQLAAKGIVNPGPIPTVLQTVAKDAGMSSSTHAKNLKRARQAGVMDMETRKAYDPITQEWKAHTVAAYHGATLVEKAQNVAHHDFNAKAPKGDPETKKNANGGTWGGAREKTISHICPCCGSDKTALKCRTCGKSSRTDLLPEMRGQKQKSKKQVERLGRQNDDAIVPPATTTAGEEDNDSRVPIVQLERYKDVLHSPPTLVNTSLEFQVERLGQKSDHQAVESFDPDDYVPEPPADLLYDDQGEFAW